MLKIYVIIILPLSQGLLHGIDEYSHKGAINKTIAIIAGGFNEILVGKKLTLANSILKNNGLILSEYPPSKPALKHQFLERNRLISAISQAVIVVEAPFKSGAINTAKHAIEQNKKLFVVPWDIKYMKGEGSNNLFLLGATPLIYYSQVLDFIYSKSKQITIEDIFENHILEISNNSEQKNVPEEYKAYYEYIKENAPVTMQEIVNFFYDKCVADISSDLMLAEINGFIKLIGNNYYIT